MPETGSEAAEFLQRVEPHERARAALMLLRQGVGEDLSPVLEDRVFDPDPEVRLLAATLLPAIGASASPELLLSALEDPCADVVVAAAEGLAAIRTPKAADALTACLASRPDLAGPLALAMERLGDSGVEEMLLDWIDQKDPAVRIAILRALGASGTARSVPAILGLLARPDEVPLLETLAALCRLRERVAGAVERSQLPADATVWIETLVASRDRRSLLTGVSLIAWLHPEDGPGLLLDLIDAADSVVRFRAREAFGAVAAGAEASVLRLIADRADRDPAAAAAALDRIVAARDASSQAAMIRLTRHPDAVVRERAAALAGRSTGIETAKALVPLLADSEGHVRARAAEAIGLLGADPAGPALETMLRDPYPDVREAALSALRSLGGYEVDAERSLAQATDPDARATVLRACDPRRAPEALLAAVGDPDPSLRVAASLSLAERNLWTDDAAVLLADEDPRVRAHALRARLSAAPALPLEPLRALLHDSDPGVRQTLALGLTRAAPIERVEWLRHLLRDPCAAVGRAAARALASQRDPDTLGALLDAAGTASLPVASAAIEALGALGDPEALPRLRAVARGGDPALRDAASLAARRIEEGAS